MSKIREQLRNPNLEELLVGAIQQVGKPSFPDKSGVMDLNALINIVDSWRSVHAIGYGNVLPNSGVLAENIADGGGLEPQDNEVYDVLAVSYSNGGGAPVEVSMRLGDLAIVNLAVPPTGTTSSELGALFPITLSKGNALKFVVTSGTSSDFTAKIAYNKRMS